MLTTNASTSTNDWQPAVGPPGTEMGGTSSIAVAASPSGATAGAPMAAARSVPVAVRVKLTDLANLTSQLAIMLQSGVDVATALQSLARQTKQPAQRELLTSIYEDVLAGNSFSVALQPHTSVFGASYVATVAAGEAAGRMAEVLAQLAQLQRGEVRLRNSIRTLLAYPVLLLSAASLVIAALTLGVLPRFAEIFAQFDTPLPVLTRILLAVAAELRGRFWFWLPLFGTVIGSGIMFLRSATGKQLLDAFMLRAVLVRSVTRNLLTSRMCRLLGLMLNSGVPLLNSLQIVRSSIKNYLYTQLLDRLIDNVMNGQGLGNTLAESEFIPPSAAEMLTTAERTGSLGTVTELLGAHYQEEAERKLRDIVTVLEPLITIGMGVIVAIVVLAVMLPVFDMATFARG